jgi:hypothetical protein
MGESKTVQRQCEKPAVLARKWAVLCADVGKEETMYRIIKFKQGKGETLARFQMEEEVATFHNRVQDQSQPDSGEATKKHCIVEFERGTDNCMMLAQFDTPEEAAKYYKTVKDKHKPFGPFFVLALELQPGGDYDDLQRKPNYQKTGSWGKKR